MLNIKELKQEYLEKEVEKTRGILEQLIKDNLSRGYAIATESYLGNKDAVREVMKELDETEGITYTVTYKLTEEVGGMEGYMQNVYRFEF